MRYRVLAIVFLISAVSLTLSLIRGQDRSESSPPTPAPALPTAPAAVADTDAGTPRPAKPLRDLSGLSQLQKQMLHTAQRGADWLFRMHGVKGRFVPGYLPALKQEMENDHYLRQAGAAFALARGARFTGEERYAARATQAVLALLEDTIQDPGDATARYTALPGGVVNRVGAAGALVLAISELPAPQKDLLDRSEQLGNYIRKRIRPDGSLAFAESDDKAEFTAGVDQHPGLALHGLMRSHRHRPQAWKVEATRKAAGHYVKWWREHRSIAFVPDHVAAYAEAHAVSKDRVFADAVFEMADWLCTLQYTQIEPRRLLWFGGFMAYHGGRPLESAPTAESAACAEALVEACRVARELGDVARFQRYGEAAERCLQFLATLQYTDAGTQHFAAWYRPRIVGGFHASHQDGNLRIDHTQHAVAALFGYLEHVVK
jgi:hypothetical protein